MKERTTNQASADSVMNDLRTTLVFQPNDPGSGRPWWGWCRWW